MRIFSTGPLKNNHNPSVSPLIQQAVDAFVRDYRDSTDRDRLAVGELVIYGARGVLYGPTPDYAATLNELGKMLRGFRLRGEDFIVLSIPGELPANPHELASKCIFRSERWDKLLRD